jgi:uncharacterized membrane protein YeiH
METFFYALGLLATITFSATGVLAVRAHRIDIFGVLVVGMVTAIGGGTIRDLVLDVPVFWLEDASYLWCALLAALATFVLRDLFSRGYRLLLYLDALGVALFAALAINKTLALGLDSIHAAVMGVVTGIGGGILRDLLTGRPTLIMMKDLYATPILFGIVVQLSLLSWTSASDFVAAMAGVLIIFSTRSAAIYFHWHMPDILAFHDE